MPFKTIAAEFDAFAAEVIPEDASPVQWSAMKTAFFAGFSMAFLNLMGDGAVEATDAEIERYGAAVIREANAYAVELLDSLAAMEE